MPNNSNMLANKCVYVFSDVTLCVCVCPDGESWDEAEWHPVDAVTHVQRRVNPVCAVRAGLWLAGVLSICQQLVSIDTLTDSLSPVSTTRVDGLLEQSLDFCEPDILPATQHTTEKPQTQKNPSTRLINSASGNVRPSTRPVLTGNGNRSPVSSGR